MTDTEKINIVKMQKDLEFIREGMDRNFKDHETIKKMFKEGLDKKVSFSRYKVVELIAYALAGSTLLWALNQVLGTITLVKAFF